MNNINEKIVLRVILMMIPDEISMGREATTICLQILFYAAQTFFSKIESEHFLAKMSLKKRRCLGLLCDVSFF